jgi:hypothetical protein
MSGETVAAHRSLRTVDRGEEVTLQGPLDNGVNVYEDVVQRVVSTP